MGALTDAAYAAIPRYTRTLNGAALAKKYRNGRIGVANTLDTAMAKARDQIADLIAAGKDLPMSLIDELAAAERRDRGIQLLSIVTRDAVANLTVDLDTVVQEGYEHACDYLSEQLEALVTEVREEIAPNVEGIRDTYDAQVRGNTRWTRLVALTEVYDEIRTAQTTILNTVDDHKADAARRWGTHALYADAANVHPFWQRMRSNAARNSNPTTDLGRLYVAWLNDYPGANLPASMWIGSDESAEPSTHSWWGRGDRGVELLWICQNTRPWVPTLDTLNSADSAALAAVRKVERLPMPAQLEARARLYRVTGQRDEWQIPTTIPMANSLDDTKENIMKRSKLDKKIAHARGNAESQREAREQAARREATTRD